MHSINVKISYVTVRKKKYESGWKERSGEASYGGEGKHISEKAAWPEVRHLLGREEMSSSHSAPAFHT